MFITIVKYLVNFQVGYYYCVEQHIIIQILYLHSIHCPTGPICQRSDPGFNKCVAEKLNDLRATVAKGKNFTNRSDTKIGNWSLITSCDQLVPTPCLQCCHLGPLLRFHYLRSTLQVKDNIFIAVVMTTWEHRMNLKLPIFMPVSIVKNV